MMKKFVLLLDSAIFAGVIPCGSVFADVVAGDGGSEPEVVEIDDTGPPSVGEAPAEAPGADPGAEPAGEAADDPEGEDGDDGAGSADAEATVAALLAALDGAGAAQAAESPAPDYESIIGKIGPPAAPAPAELAGPSWMAPVVDLSGDGSWRWWEVAAEPAIPEPVETCDGCPVPMWDIPILSVTGEGTDLFERSVSAPGGEAGDAIAELVARLGDVKIRKTIVSVPYGDASGAVALYSINQREVLVFDPLDPEGRVTAEALVLVEDLLRSATGGAKHEIAPALVRLLYAVALAHDGVIEISSGYRQPGPGTKPTSYHTMGLAADVRHPYLPAKSIVDFAKAWGAGGVGYYPKSGFVHMDAREKPYYWIDYEDGSDEIVADMDGKLSDAAAAVWEKADAGLESDPYL